MFLAESLCAGALCAGLMHNQPLRYARYCARYVLAHYAGFCAHYACNGACTARTAGHYGQHTVAADKTLPIRMTALCAAAGGLRVLCGMRMLGVFAVVRC